MLKVNYPQFAERIDSEPVNIDEDLLEKKPETVIHHQSMTYRSKPVEIVEDSPEAKQKQYEQDKEKSQNLDAFTEEIVKGLENIKQVDKFYAESDYKERFKSIKYFEREEDQELKELYFQDQQSIKNMRDNLFHKVDGVIDIDMHGQVKITSSLKEPEKVGIQESGTYVMRDGKLVPGKSAVREQATFTNWYCSNADPEDIIRHRELMDRMHYRGPKWEGVGIPKSIIEEQNPVYRKVNDEPHPAEIKDQDLKEGKKEWEHVVR